MATIDRRGATVSATDAPASSTPNPDLAIKTAVRVVATSNINIQTFGVGTIDGVALAAGDRVLLTGQTDATQNGIYNVGTGVWGMSSDFQNSSQVAAGLAVFVRSGTLNAFSTWHLTTPDPIVLGTTALTFVSTFVFAGTVTINPPANTLTPGLVITQSLPTTGSLSAPFYPNSITITGDALNGNGNSINLLTLNYNWGGANAKNGRAALLAQSGLNIASTLAVGDGPLGAALLGIASVNAGGTNTGAGALGAVAGANIIAQLLNGATNFASVTGVEVDAEIFTGASAKNRWGVASVSIGTGSAAANQDAAYAIWAAAGAPSFKTGYLLSSNGGGAPIATAGTVFGTDGTNWMVANGVDISSLTITGNAWKSPGWQIDGTGALQGTSANSSSITSANTSPLGLASSNAGGLTLPLNNTVASKTVLIAFEEQSAVKWYAGKDTDLAFILNDNVLGKTIFRAASNNSGIVDFGVPGTFTGQAGFAGVTSGRTVVQALAAASGTLTLPSATDTIAVLAASQAFTNKTYNGLTVTTTTGTLTIANGKTLTANSTLTLAGTDGKTLTVSNSGTLAGGDGFTLSIAANKTLTASNSLTLAGTDGKSLTLTNSLTVTTNDGTLAFGAASKTLTVNNSLTLAGTDGKTVTYNASTTFAGTDGKTLTISNSGTLSGGDGFTLSIAANKTLTASNSLTLAGTDGKSLTLTNSLTVTTNDGTLAFGAASKTLTVNNSLTLAGTDATTMTFPGTSQTIAGLAVSGQTFTVAQTVTPTQAANTSADGLILADTTAASAGNQQYSPRLRITGQGWKTNATAASQTVDWIIENKPTQQAANPGANLVFSSQINGGGYASRMEIQDDGTGGLVVPFTAASSKSVQFQLNITGTGQVGVFYSDTSQVIMGAIANLPLLLKTNNTTQLQISGAGAVNFPNVGTTASAANAFLDNAASNNLLRSTSSLRYKTDVRPLALEELRAAITLSPIRFRSTSPADDPERDFVGLAAEEVAAVLPDFIHLDPDGRPDGVQYDRLAAVALLAVVKDQQARIGALEAALTTRG